MADLISRATLLFALGLVRFEVLRSICSHMFSVHTIILSLDWFSEQIRFLELERHESGGSHNLGQV